LATVVIAGDVAPNQIEDKIMKTYEELSDLQKEYYNNMFDEEFVGSDSLYRREIMEVFELVASDYPDDED
jgi:predicted Zn-dependent peptidase